jgi:hypothetical protein
VAARNLIFSGLQNGDTKSDPDMETKIYPDQKTTVTFTYRNDYIGLHQVVYPEFCEVLG